MADVYDYIKTRKLKMNYLTLLKKSIAENRDRIALVDHNGSRRISYVQLDEQSGKVAGKLHAMGAKTGNFVIVDMARTSEYLAAYFGVLKAGCGVIPLTPQYPDERVAFIERESEALCIIREGFFDDIDSYEPFEAATDDSSPALMIYTSGSTGRPKGIVHSAASIAAAVMRQQTLLDGISHPVYAASAPFSFIAHTLENLVILSLGGTVHILSDEIRRDPVKLVEYYSEYKIECSHISPQLLKLMMNEDLTPRRIFTGSELLSGVSLKNCELINLYGQSETAMAVCHFKVEHSHDSTPIGRPFDDLKAVVLGENGLPAPQGETGELCIEGNFNVEYFKNPELTAKTFIPTENGTLLIHTGDMAFFDENGDIVYVSRKDWMVKINGQRVEPLEVERALSQSDGILHAAVRVLENASGEKYLAAYYDGEIKEEAALRAELSGTLPEYMIPRMFIHMDALPLNINGKLDRPALPDPADLTKETSELENDMQKKIAGLCLAVLDRGSIGPDTDLYALGISSIGVIKLSMLLDENFHIPVKITDIKTNNTVRKLEQMLLKSKELEKHEILADYPLTQTQQGIFVECMSNPDTTIYNIPKLLRLGSGVDADRLVSALKETVNAHPYLKTRLFTSDAGDIRAKRLDTDEPVIEVTEGNAPEIEELVRPFDLFNDRLYRIKVFRNEGGICLFTDFHHIIFDGTSEGVFLKDLDKAYAGETPVTESYTGYEAALDEAVSRSSKAYDEARKYYETLLDGCDTDNLPLAIPETSEIGTGNVSLELSLSQSDVAKACERLGISANALFNSAFGYALCKLLGKDDTVYSTVYNGRDDSRKANSISMYVKTLPVRCTSGEGESIAEYVRKTDKQFLDSMANDIYSFADISAAFGIGSDVLFVYQGVIFDPETLCGDKYTISEYRPESTKGAMVIQVFPTGDTFRISAEFKTELYSEELMLAILELIVQTATEFTRKETLREVDLVSSHQKEVLDGFNRNETEYDTGKTIIDIFRENIDKYPDRTAVVYCGNSYTYREVDRISDNIAAHLMKKGIGRGDVVSILIGRSEYMPIASLGVLKTGAAYQPLDSSYPQERLNFMVGDAAAKHLIADASLTEKLSEWGGETLLTDDIPSLPDATAAEISSLRDTAPKPEDLFILLYTSGSTGVPKGVMLEHRNIAAFCSQHITRMEIDENSVVAAYASYGFDADMMDIYPTLCAGAELVIVHEEIRLDLPAILEYYKELRVTHAFMTTQVGRQFAMLCDSPYVKFIYVGGETLVPVTLTNGIRLVNIYGPTETTVYVTSHELNGAYKRVPIGCAVDNVKLYVADKNMRRLPVGVPGELCIAGHQVSRGYLNRPEKTAEVYIDNPFETKEGYEHVYRTGDIVRLLPDGNVDFVGRNDGQVKVRGFRIELSEVEEIIGRFEGIKDVTVAAFDAPAGGKEIAAYIVSDVNIDTKKLKDFIRAEKPSYMVPAVIMQIDRIPLNQNQKVNKKALPKPELGSSDNDEGEVKNGVLTEFEEQLLAILKDTTGIGTTDVTTELVALGVTSISAISFVTVVEKKLGVNVPVAKLLKGASIMDIENEVVRSLLSGTGMKKAEAPAEKHEILDEYPLTQSQLGVYYESMQRPDTTLYNIPFCLEFDGIDSGRLSDAVKAAVNAHAFLNTHIKTGKTGFLQVRNDDAEASVTISELEGRDIKDVFAKFIRPFALHTGPLYRFEIVCDNGTVYLMMDFHHIVFDGFSVNLFMESVKQAYESGKADIEEYAYFDYALDEEEATGGEEYTRSEQYFNDLLSDFESTTEVPADISGKAEDGMSATVWEYVDRKSVENFCKENKITPSSLFLASSFYTVSRFANTKDVYITTISNGRSNSKTRSAVGMFVRTLPVAIRRKDGASVLDYIRDSSDSMNGSIASELYPFTEIAKKYGYGTDVMYECQLGVLSEITIGGKVARSIELDDGTPKFKLKVAVMDSDNGIGICVEYNNALYSEKYMQTFARSLKICTERMMSDPSAEVKTLSLLSESDASTLEKFSQSGTGELKHELVHRMFEAEANEHPDRTAVIACDATLTFGELDRQANIIANALIAKGVGRGDAVVLLLPRRSFYFAAAFGVMKTGAAFIPCDPQYPADRINLITEDSGAQYIVMTADKLPLYPGEKALDITDLLAGSDESAPQTEMSSDDLVYEIYTSGSTGKPKGVLIRHIGVCNYFADDPANILYHTVIEKNVERILCITTISFDMSMKDSFGMLCNGRTIIFANEEEMNDPMAITDLIKKHDIHMFSGTPSRLQQYMEYPPFVELLGGLKMVVCGAEMYPAALKDRLKSLTDAVLLNTYGPTEITISSNMANLTHADRVSVGRPLYNYREFIVDSDENLLPPGIVGELYVGGPGVAKGYQNLDELTQKNFVNYRGMRVYKTGDYSRWDEDGSVIILGRKDNQIKLRGLRIEPGEIESIITQQPSVTQALVLIKKLNGQDTLCAYYTASEPLDPAKLRDALKTKLTHYMVPAAYLQLEAFPVNANGKTDRKLLPEPIPVRVGDFVEASGETERFFCDVFAKTLKLDKVGAEDDFFENGGSSLTATSIVVAASEANYRLSYSDIFSHTTPRALAELVTGEKIGDRDTEIEDYDYTKIKEYLSLNSLDSFRNGETREIGNILLTGATGYMGIHVLFNYLKNETGKAYCMLRRGRHETAKLRLKNMMFFYFGEEASEAFEERVEVLEGDVTQYKAFEQFERFEINTIFNCAANVKHFSKGTDIEDVNIGGAENCIEFCRRKGARLIHFSTTSTSGDIRLRDGEKAPTLNEQTLYLGQILNNKYTHSKFIAERDVLAAAADGLDAKIIRVGTLSPRNSDGEFQINYLSNNFMGRLRTYALVEAFPYSLCQSVVRLGAIDVSVDAFMKLAKTPKECCLFNAVNSHSIFLSDIVECLKERGRNIRLVEENEFNELLLKAGEDPSKAAIISSLLAYVNAAQDEKVKPVGIDCTYTNEILSRLGFFWNITDKSYVERFLSALEGLLFFDSDNLIR